ncbi:hypothetical protein GX50_03167 [[Emmonsia] crescens]|uniref:Uncharacterized protein n=1 Tax=[Emmonsia] crescens TaxID=73230 RepID=A0A2B7ZL23_9EURO|nr:hypothetical protein GX50_03167 [Emmonsia crescens]
MDFTSQAIGPSELCYVRIQEDLCVDNNNLGSVCQCWLPTSREICLAATPERERLHWVSSSQKNEASMDPTSKWQSSPLKMVIMPRDLATTTSRNEVSKLIISRSGGANLKFPNWDIECQKGLRRITLFALERAR